MDCLHLADAILVLDRGFIPGNVVEGIINRECSYLLPLRRDSAHYETRIHLNDRFLYHKRLIQGGKREIGDRTLYLFEDEGLRLEERKTLFEQLNEGTITKGVARE